MLAPLLADAERHTSTYTNSRSHTTTIAHLCTHFLIRGTKWRHIAAKELLYLRKLLSLEIIYSNCLLFLEYKVLTELLNAPKSEKKKKKQEVKRKRERVRKKERERNV